MTKFDFHNGPSAEATIINFSREISQKYQTEIINLTKFHDSGVFGVSENEIKRCEEMRQKADNVMKKYRDAIYEKITSDAGIDKPTIGEVKEKYNTKSDNEYHGVALTLYHAAKAVGRFRSKGAKRQVQLQRVNDALVDFRDAGDDIKEEKARALYDVLDKIESSIINKEWNLMGSGMEKLCHQYKDDIKVLYPEIGEKNKNSPRSSG